MKLYHASPVLIERFDYTNGVHFGSYESALQAVLRKTTDVIYMHQVITTHDKYYLSEDVGGFDRWLDVIDQAEEYGYDVIGYKNLYEPSSSKSYVFINDKYITIERVVKLTVEEAEVYLDRYF